MTLEHIDQARLQHALDLSKQLVGELSDIQSVISLPPDTAPTPVKSLRFDAPVGTVIERSGAKLWPGDWWVAMDYGEAYPPAMHRSDYHTGVDLNLPNQADSGAPVYACADGTVVAVGPYAGWLLIVVVQHQLEDGTNVWSRYAHLANLQVTLHQPVLRGQQLGVIGDYGTPGKADDHLHFDIARIDLGQAPTDWPNLDRARLLRDYFDPLQLIQQRHGYA
jgi:murein DD-endopeptidase MepM/ murein hydrolase activator NlpD